MPVADSTTTLRAYLLTVAAVTAEVAARIYGEEIPAEASAVMPQKSIVLVSSGGRQGLGASSDLDVGNISLSTRCYAPTLYEARALDRVVYEAMNNIRRWATTGQGGLHFATQESGPFVMRDPDTTWPFALSTYRLMTGEVIH